NAGSDHMLASDEAADGSVVSSRLENFRVTNIPTPKKTSANPPIMNNVAGKPVNSAGILKIQSAVAATVRISTATMETSDTVKTAGPIASRSTSNTAGQTARDTSVNLIIGSMTSSNASGGKSWPHQVGALPGRRRCNTIGKMECRMANSR